MAEGKGFHTSNELLGSRNSSFLQLLLYFSLRQFLPNINFIQKQSQYDVGEIHMITKLQVKEIIGKLHTHLNKYKRLT